MKWPIGKYGLMVAAKGILMVLLRNTLIQMEKWSQASGVKTTLQYFLTVIGYTLEVALFGCIINSASPNVSHSGEQQLIGIFFSKEGTAVNKIIPDSWIKNFMEKLNYKKPLVAEDFQVPRTGALVPEGPKSKGWYNNISEEDKMLARRCGVYAVRIGLLQPEDILS